MYVYKIMDSWPNCETFLSACPKHHLAFGTETFLNPHLLESVKKTS